MKNKKSGFILSIVSICLSVFAIAFGVYSLTTAKLTISGSLGFTVHDCKVSVSAYMYGHALTVDGKPTTIDNKTYLIDKNNSEATESSPYVVCDNDSGLSFNVNKDSYKGVYFSNLSTTGKPQPITIVINLTNVSENVIYFEDTTLTTTNYSVLCDNPLNVLYTDSVSNSCTITYTLLLNANADGTYSNISTPVNVSLGLSFSKLNTDIASTGYTIDESSKTISGVPAKTSSDPNYIVIPSVFSDKTSVKFETLGDGMENIKNITDYTNVIILEGITKVNNSAFSGCEQIEKVALPDGVTSLVGSTFTNCRSLVNVYIPKTTANIGEGAFANCVSLTTMIIPGSVGGLGAIFFSCTELKKVILEEGVRSLTETFSGCSNLSIITLPDSITSLGFLAFADCVSLTTIDIPKNVDYIYSGAFNGTGITAITIPASVTEMYNPAEYGFFERCTNLKKVYFEKTDNWQYAEGSSGSYSDLPSSMSFTDPIVNATKLKGDWAGYSFRQKTN